MNQAAAGERKRSHFRIQRLLAKNQRKPAKCSKAVNYLTSGISIYIQHIIYNKCIVITNWENHLLLNMVCHRYHMVENEYALP